MKHDNYDKTVLCLSEFFTVQKYEVKTSVKEESDEERFYLFTCVDGEGAIKYNGGEEKILMGDSIFIPATLGEYELVGNFTLLKSYVPNIKNEEKEILSVVEK